MTTATELPADPIRRLLYAGWPAVEQPAAEYAAGRITYERALADTLIAVQRHWNGFFSALTRADPILAMQLAKELAGDRRFCNGPPLAPIRA